MNAIKTYWSRTWFAGGAESHKTELEEIGVTVFPSIGDNFTVRISIDIDNQSIRNNRGSSL